MLYKIIDKPASSVLSLDAAAILRENDPNMYVFRYNVVTHKLHILMGSGQSWAFVNADRYINHGVVTRFTQSKKTPYSSIKDAISAAVSDTNYKVFGCNTLGEALSILREYGV